MSNPKVSICIPTFNGEEYLAQCLDSVLSQTYTDFEIIIVDDCSTDQTVSLIDRYLEKNSSIRFFKNNTNMGLVGNWNTCIRHSSGEWIKFIFQDDYLDPDCIEVFMNYILGKKFPLPIIVSERRYFSDDSSGSLPEFNPEDFITLKKLNLKNFDNEISPVEISNTAIQMMGVNFIGEPTVIMFRKDLTDEFGFFNEGFEHICDFEFFFRIAANYGLKVVPRELSWFRMHEKSTSSMNLSEKHYKISNLEPVKFAHQLLFDKIYSDVRLNLSKINRLRLKLYYYVRGFEAWSEAIQNKKDMTEFLLAAAKFPEMESLKKSSRWRRILYRLLTLKRKFYFNQ